MNILVVLAHPTPSSFNHALARAACGAARVLGHIVTFHDLYQEGIDPVLPAQEIQRNAHLEALVAQHSSPAS